MANAASAGNTSGALTNNELLPRVADSDIPSIILTYKYRLLPTRKQHAALAAILESQRQLYNGALEHRIRAIAPANYASGKELHC